MSPTLDPQLLVVSGGGLIAGLGLLVRGLGGYRRASRITDTAASRIASIAVGEVLVSGIVEAAELTLVSPLQSVVCVFYRSRIEEAEGEGMGTALREERAVGFRIRDDSGSLRVFPRGARFDVPFAFDEKTGAFGDEPPGLAMRSGSPFAPASDRDAQVAALLTVHAAPGSLAGDGDGDGDGEGWRGFAADRLVAGRQVGSRSRHYREARLEPGDVVTVLGLALPFDQLADPTGADQLDSVDPFSDDPEIAADIAAARAAGTLSTDPEDAWGNAAIPGFGIGKPVREPELDDAAIDPPLATASDAQRFERTFAITPDALVLAASEAVPLVIASGPPAAAADRQERLFLVGLLGAVLAIGSAMAMAVMVGGGVGAP
jgi:hypothetical protein